MASACICEVDSGGWREREKAREESWAPPRDTDRDEDEREVDDRTEGFRDRNPPREEASVWRRGGDEPSSWRDSRREVSDRGERRDLGVRRDDRERDVRAPQRDQDEGGSWRRGGEERREERKEEREAPPRPRERDREVVEKSTWRSDKDKEIQRRTKNETDDDGWTTVRR